MNTTNWDVADHLTGKDAILAYREAVFEDGDPSLIAAALNDVARAKGFTADPALSSDTDIGAIIRTLKLLGSRPDGEGGMRRDAHQAERHIGGG